MGVGIVTTSVTIPGRRNRNIVRRAPGQMFQFCNMSSAYGGIDSLTFGNEEGISCAGKHPPV
jgi:hypothetical protein